MLESQEDNSAYAAMREDLETSTLGKWALVYRKELIGTYGSYEEAAKLAFERFGGGPYLIRKIGASTAGTVLHHPV